MDPLNRLNPFPLLAPGEQSYAQDQAHSALVDQWLGLETERIEAALVADPALRGDPAAQQLWIGLPVQAMLTPYTELRAMLAHLAPPQGTHIVDLGAGYGRMGFVIARHHPGVRFTGYEFVRERVDEGNRCMATAALPPNEIQLLQGDLSALGFTPEAAEFYFIYDFGTRAAIEKTLRDLQSIAQTRPITVIGRGRASRDAIERNHPWLSQINPPEHCGHYSIYRS